MNKRQDEVNAGMRDDMFVIKKILLNEEETKEKDAFKKQFKSIEYRLKKLETSKLDLSNNFPSFFLMHLETLLGKLA